MDEIIFEWDPVKAELNYAKHRVTFEESKPYSMMKMQY